MDSLPHPLGEAVGVRDDGRAVERSLTPSLLRSSDWATLSP